MKNVEAISAPLRRNIKSGKAYNKLMPDSSCVPISFGNGNNNTIEGVEFMSEMVTDYQHHVEKLAPILKGQTLAETVLNVKEFLYNHIQYLGDGNLQQLRSPACAWHQRQTGVDCKSYTIFAVALLRQLGITTYIRQIKQPLYYQDQYTHVYAIVPKDQNNTPNTSNFSGDYYVVDATLQHNNEAHFTQKKDKLMSGLPYVGLAGTASPVNDTSIDQLLKMAPAFQNAGFTRQEWENLIRYIETLKLEGFTDRQIIFRLQKNGIVIKTQNSNGRLFSPQQIDNGQWLRRFFQTTQGLGNASEGGEINVDSIMEGVESSGWIDSALSDIGGFFGDLLGFGSGGWYTKDEAKAHMIETSDHLDSFIKKINEAVVEGNNSKLSNAVFDFKATSKLLVLATQAKINEGWSSQTMSALRAYRDYAKKYSENGVKLLDEWISRYCDVLNTKTQNVSSQNYAEFLSGQLPTYVNPRVSTNISKQTLQVKPNVEVKAFYITRETIETNEYGFNASSVLNSITEVIRTVTGGGNNTPTTPSTNNGNQNTGGGKTPVSSNSNSRVFNPNTGNVKMSSIGWGVAAIGGGILAKVLYDNFTKNKK